MLTISRKVPETIAVVLAVVPPTGGTKIKASVELFKISFFVEVDLDVGETRTVIETVLFDSWICLYGSIVG